MHSCSNSNTTCKNDTSGLNFCQECNFFIPTICKQILLIISIFLCFVILIVVINSRKHLIKIEFVILLYLSFILIFIKIKLFVQTKLSNNNKFEYIFYYILETSVSQYYFLIFYYSIFHLTIWFGKKIRKLITNLNFFIFFSIISTTLGILNTFLVISIKNDSYQDEFKLCIFDFERSYSVKIILINLIYTIPAMLVFLIYCFLNFFLLKKIIFKKKSIVKLHSDVKNFRIIFLFSIFSLISNVACLLWLSELIKLYFENETLTFLFCVLTELIIFFDFLSSIILLFSHRKLQTIQIVMNFFGKKI